MGDHSAQCYSTLLNSTRSTASFATILHERHYLEGLDLDKVSDETAKELANLFGSIICKLCGLCTQRGLIFSVIGPQLLHILIPVLMEDEYELVREYEIIEIIHDHILYVLHHKIENDASLKERFKWNKISNDGQSIINGKLNKIRNNLLND